MIMLFRLIWVIIAAFFRPKLGLGGQSRLHLRVWPNDLDINIHMNNARYLAMMDLGRTDWIIRSGAWRLMLHQRMAPIIGGCMVRYRRSLGPFQAYHLDSSLLGWDERWLYVRQSMSDQGGLACLAVQRVGFTRSGRLVPTAELAERLGHCGPAILVPDWVGQWSAAELAFVETVTSENVDISRVKDAGL
jgi:acyl-CoA thioesterase FadM